MGLPWVANPYVEGAPMVDKRENDLKSYTKFRTSRFFKESCQWYFLTREGSQEGPFESKIEAEIRLQDYIKIMVSDLLPTDSTLSMTPH
jgi:hypothetical protein